MNTNNPNINNQVNNFIPNNSNINPLNTMNNHQNTNMNQQQGNWNQNSYTEYMKYVNYYNPMLVQNYYAMFNQMGYANNNTNNFQSFFSTPYTMNRNMVNSGHMNMNYQGNQGGQGRYNMQYTQNNNYNDIKRVNKNISLNPEEASELVKWVDSRKRNFPSFRKVEEKQTVSKIKEDAGILSKLELKLRDKLHIMSKINKKGYVKKNRRRHRNKRTKRRRDVNEPIEEGEIKEIQDEEEVIKNENGEIIIHEKHTERNNNNNQNRNNNGRHNKQNNNKDKDKDNDTKNQNRRYFRYRKNKIYDELIKTDKIKEMNIILQAFRYFVNENLV